MPEMNIEAQILIALGLVVCGGGWLLFILSSRLIGFIAGVWGGYVLVMLASEALSIQPFMGGITGQITGGVVIFLTGLLGALMVRLLVKVFLFVSGNLFGFLISAAVSGFPMSRFEIGHFQIMLTDIPLWAVVAAFIFGIFFMIFERGFIILYTAASGAYLIATALNAPSYIFFALMAAGALLQFRLSRGEDVKNLEIITAERVRGPR